MENLEDGAAWAEDLTSSAGAGFIAAGVSQ